MLRERRERKAYQAAMAAEIERTSRLADEVRAELSVAEGEIGRTLSGVPGASPRCELCGAPVRLVREKWGRGKNQWSSGWFCTRCRHRHAKEVVHGSWDNQDLHGEATA